MWLCMLLHVWLASWISQFDFAGWFSPFWLAGWIFTTFVVVWISGTSAWADMRILEVFHLVENSFVKNWGEFVWISGCCKPFWLVIWGEVILLGFHLMVLHFDVAFAVDVVLDVTKGWRNVWLNPKVSPFLCLLGLSVLILSPGWWRNQLSHLMTRDRFSIRWSVESAGVWRGGDI